MKQSEINHILNETKDFLNDMKFKLPPWAFWGPEDWEGKEKICNEIIDCDLGWDITDFGSGDFNKIGLVLFTIRNGNPKKPFKPYCEKLLVVLEEQITPMHYHWSKMEDIINRGGGDLVFELEQYSEDDKLIDTQIKIKMDGIEHQVNKDEKIVLKPGDSITLPPFLAHRFYGKKGTGKVLVGEVSTVNDDRTDNRFIDAVGRFPEVEEDVPPIHILFNDYPNYL